MWWYFFCTFFTEYSSTENTTRKYHAVQDAPCVKNEGRSATKRWNATTNISVQHALKKYHERVAHIKFPKRCKRISKKLPQCTSIRYTKNKNEPFWKIYWALTKFKPTLSLALPELFLSEKVVSNLLFVEVKGKSQKTDKLLEIFPLFFNTDLMNSGNREQTQKD